MINKNSRSIKSLSALFVPKGASDDENLAASLSTRRFPPLLKGSSAVIGFALKKLSFI